MASRPTGKVDMEDPFVNLPVPLKYTTINPNVIHNRATNPDGSISTVRTISFNDGSGEILIPTVVGNKVVSNEDAINHYRKTGESFGTFKTVEDADRWADYIHTLHAQLLANESQDK